MPSPPEAAVVAALRNLEANAEYIPSGWRRDCYLADLSLVAQALTEARRQAIEDAAAIVEREAEQREDDADALGPDEAEQVDYYYGGANALRRTLPAIRALLPTATPEGRDAQ